VNTIALQPQDEQLLPTFVSLAHQNVSIAVMVAISPDLLACAHI
jgi:hypothetical protein